MRTAKLDPEADVELWVAAAWYKERSPDAARRFIVDRCLPRARHEVQKEDAIRGYLKTDNCGDGKAITVDEFDLLVRSGLLIPKDRFREAAGYRMDPVLDLLRPSTAAKLRGP